MSREKRPRGSAGAMNGWENCDVFFPQSMYVCMYVYIYIYISFYVLLTTILRCFSFAPSSAAVMCRRSFCTSLQMSPESGPESSSLRCRRGQIVRFLSV